MKINDLACEVLSKLQNGYDADGRLIYESGTGNSPAEIDFIILQLRMFGYL